MQIILDILDEFDSTESLVDIEAVTEEALSDWLTEFEGWGLLSSILDTGIHRHVLLALAYTRDNWNEETGGEYSDEKVFDAVKQVYDAMPGKELHTLIPRFGLSFEEIVNGSKTMERKKELLLFFHAKWNLEIKFSIEWRKGSQSLVNLAAETVSQCLLTDNNIVELPIPATLFPIVHNKFNEVTWIRSYWASQPDHVLKQDHQQHKDDIEEQDQADIPEAEEDVEEIRDEGDDERFLASLMLMPPLEPAVDRGQTRETGPTGIDSLLLLWVGIFLFIAMIIYFVNNLQYDDDEDQLDPASIVT